MTLVRRRGISTLMVAGTFHRAAPVAIRAGTVEAAGDRFLVALGGVICMIRAGKFGGMCDFARSISISSFIPLVDRVTVLAVLHVDEVENDEPADVAQADLAGGLVAASRFTWDDEVVLSLLFLCAPGIHVDGDEGLGSSMTTSPPLGQRHAAAGGLLQLTLDVEAPRRWGCFP